jgi:hypothetical protein
MNADRNLFRSSFIIHRSSFPPHAARLTLPPCTFVDTGAHAGPLCFRGLNQNAVNHTVAPAAVVLGNCTCTAVLLVFPSNFHADISAGGTAPT